MKEPIEAMTDSEHPGTEPVRRARGGWRDFWQLHVPLVLVLALCTVITIIEAKRASEGVWRAWAYMFEWPLIGLFTIWIWHRYRTEGSVTKGLVERWRERVSRISAESESEAGAGEPMSKVAADAAGSVAGLPNRAGDAQPIEADPQLEAWNEYVEDLRRREPPGAPPS